MALLLTTSVISIAAHDPLKHCFQENLLFYKEWVKIAENIDPTLT
jgi:hypothetical protein